jgi:hypothetical protein
MKPNGGGQFNPPVAVATGDRIDIDYSRRTGMVVYAVQGFRFPDPSNVPPAFVKNGRVVTPFRHVLALLDPNNVGQPAVIMASQNDKNVFVEPVFSPDGSAVAVSVGTYTGEASVQRTGLLSVPARQGAGAAPTGVHRGAVYNVSFSSDGHTLAFVAKDATGKGTIHLMNSDGSNDRSLTEGKGNFGSPRFSPQ